MNAKDAALTALFLSLAGSAGYTAWRVGELSAAAQDEIKTTAAEARKAIYSYRAIAVDARREWIRSSEMQNSMIRVMGSTSKTLEITSSSIGENMTRVSKTVETTGQEASELLRSTRRLIERSDASINGDLMPTVTATVRQAGDDEKRLSTLAADGLSAGGRTISLRFNEIASPANMERVGAILRNTDEMTAQVACITADGAATTAYYRQKLTHPSKWDRVKSVLNTGLYLFGEVIAPIRFRSRVTVEK